MLVAIVAALAWLGAEPGLAPRSAPYADHLLVDVDVHDRASLARLFATGVDVLPDHPHPGVVPVLVAPEDRAALWSGEWTLRVLPIDVQAQVDAEALRLASQTSVVPGGGGFFADFRDGAAIDAELDALVLANPELVTSFDIGESIEGRTIRAIRITAQGEDDRPAVIVTAGQHAREWIAISSGMYVIDQLVLRAEEPEIAALLAAVQVYVIPVVNPDGYAYSWTDERYWRKNRRDGVGVDTNRNFAYGWGGEGASDMPEDENYRGEAAFSEPEVVAVRDFVQAHPELVAHVDVHSYGQLVLYPWGHIYQEAPDDAQLSATAQTVENEMEAVFGTNYTALQGVDLYPAAGNAIDWSYGDAGLHAITMELRPNDEEVNFLIPPVQIVPVGDEVMAGLLVLLGYANGVVPDPTDGGEESTSGGGESSSGGATTTSSTSSSDESSSSTTDDFGTTGVVDPSGGVTTAPMTTTSTTSSASNESETSGDASIDGDGDGCGCATTPRSSWLGAALLLLPMLRRRRD
jgi:MYXO-CTERM domain-containing protein